MKKLYLVVRSAMLWVVSALHFFPGALVLMFVALFIDPRKNDRPQRFFARNIVRMAGARLRVRSAPGFDARRTSLFISNHVNLFDPFVLYSAIPQFVRGWELESHFRIPVYGWMMKRFGNIPVADQRTPGRLKNLLRLTRQAFEDGISLVVFPEGSRTRTGRVGPFQPGIFRILHELEYPIVPVSIVGSFQFHHKGSWLLHPATIEVYIHDTIETKGLNKETLESLPERVRQIIAEPVDRALGIQPD